MLLFSVSMTSCVDSPEQNTTAVAKKANPNKAKKAAKANAANRGKSKYVKKSSLKATLKENLKINEADALRIVNLRKQLTRTLKAKKHTPAQQRRVTEETNKKIKNVLGNKFNKYNNLMKWYKARK